jgi:hypothetical protein
MRKPQNVSNIKRLQGFSVFRLSESNQSQEDFQPPDKGMKIPKRLNIPLLSVLGLHDKTFVQDFYKNFIFCIMLLIIL